MANTRKMMRAPGNPEASRGAAAPLFIPRISSLKAGFQHSNGLPGTLGERVYQALKKDIIRGAYQPGEALGEKDLAKRYRSSRTPVREAAVRLQQENLLRIVPNRGYFVAQITIQRLNDIYEFRAAAETACAELAARKGADPELMDDLKHLAETGYQIEDRASYERFIEVDTAFHIGVAQLTRNQLLIRAVTDMRSQMERVMYAAIDIGYFGELPVHEHCEILEAIRDRDAQLARKRMYDHIVSSKGKVIQLAGGEPPL